MAINMPGQNLLGVAIMISLNEVKNIIRQIKSENGAFYINALDEDVCYIAFRIDFFKCGNEYILNKHIDIEFTFGGYCELHEAEISYQYIFELCNLQAIKTIEEVEIILYQK